VITCSDFGPIERRLRVQSVGPLCLPVSVGRGDKTVRGIVAGVSAVCLC
jgi:hypothetical protein